VPRRVAVVPLLLAAAVAGCGGTASPEQARHADFLKRYGDLTDTELARLCPSLYPRDFLTRPKDYDKYGFSKPKKGDPRFKPTARDKAAARAAGCTDQGTPPKKK
jgi:hypothetical protein